MSPHEEIVRTGGGTLAQAGAAADAIAGRMAWKEYLDGLAANSLRAQRADLECFARFMAAALVNNAPTGIELQQSAESWAGVTPGLLLAFREWLMQQGYSIATVNRRLTTAKVYGRMAGIETAGAKVFGHKKGMRRDAKRTEAGIATRVGAKKAYKAVMLTQAGAKALLERPETPQGRRDAVLMALLLEHGLRCGEVALLTVENVNLHAGTMTFYRPKVNKTQTHRLTPVSLKALKAYAMPKSGPLLRTTFKGGAFEPSDDPAKIAKARLQRERRARVKGAQPGEPAAKHEGMTERAITARVRELGKEIGIDNLSAHDCRHYWATRATEAGTHPRRLQQAGGWNSPAMVMRYVNEAEIANEGVIL